MTDAPLMLGVSGLRGIVGKSLTPEVAARFAAAFGAWIKAAKQQSSKAANEGGGGPPVVVGADGRAGFEPIRDAAVQGLLAAGCNPWDIGVAMTPTIGVVADHDDAAGALVITASHNPQEWNGIKCLVRSEGGREVVSACAPSAAAAREIIELFRRGMDRPPPPVRGWAPPGDDRADVGGHVGPVAAAVGEWPKPGRIRSRRYRVLLDSVNGAGRWAGRTLLAETFGCELIHHGAEPGGVFPHPPEPTKENLESVCKAVVKFSAQVGFAQDPDGDRLAIVDEEGNYIGEEYTLALAAEAVLGARRDEGTKNGPGGPDRPEAYTTVLVTNLSTSRMIDDIAAQYGARVIRTPVGEANVVEAMKREKAAGRDVLLGGEGNGGVIWPNVTYVRDSLSAMALVLSLMARTGKKVSELVAEIPAYAIEKRKVDLARREDAAPAVQKIAAAYKAHRPDLQDGVRVDWDGPLPGGSRGKAWLHVRPSNTEPIMRLIAEAPTAAGAKAILEEAAHVIAGRRG